MSKGRNDRKRRNYQVRLELYRDATVCPLAVEQSYTGQRIHIPAGIPKFDLDTDEDGSVWSREECLFCHREIARVMSRGPNGSSTTTGWFTEPFIIELL